MTPRAVRVYSVRILCLGDVGLIDDDGPIPKTNGYARAWPSGRLLSRPRSAWRRDKIDTVERLRLSHYSCTSRDLLPPRFIVLVTRNSCRRE